MRERVNKNFIQLDKNTLRNVGQRFTMLLSLFVVVGVFWSLKLTGLTLAGEAFCGMEEHIHGDGCPTGRLICGQDQTPGHMHDESCILRQLICGQEEALPHVHDETCLYRELVCAEEERESHAHDDSCHALILACTEEESEGHTHDGDCYSSTLICTEEDPEHIHGTECYENILTCAMEETEGHCHNDACYLLGEDFICGQEEEEGHVHSEECYILHEDSFICCMEETEGHSHTDECFYVGVGFGCGMTEEEGHVHTEECLTSETELGCGEVYTPAHTHTEECYEALTECPLEEHIHIESCYSDINADIETSDDWELSLTDMTRGPTIRENVVLVAQSQLGYEESGRNFQVDASGVRRGITRYGQWYGNPCGDWSAMFVSFCLHYAGAEDLPANAGPESMRLEWEEEKLYLPYGEYEPAIGDLVFLMADEAEIVADSEIDFYEYTSDVASAVAIIADIDESGMTIIQGDVDGKVEELYIEAGDSSVLGYGLVLDEQSVIPSTVTDSFAWTVDYSPELFTPTSKFVVYTYIEGSAYAFDGNGNAVPIVIGEDGDIYTEDSDEDILLWIFTALDEDVYLIQNVATGLYMYGDANGGANVLTTEDAYANTVTPIDSGVMIQNNVSPDEREAIALFMETSSDELVFYLAASNACTVWLDGTDGGMGSLTGSPNTAYTVQAGDMMELPTEWTSPSRYSYKLRGWYDVTNSRYYEPGEEMEVTGDAVLYADWVAATYDLGQYNAFVADTVSTSEFITTHVFDYNYLFNAQSANAEVTVSADDHSETWTMVTDGTVSYQNQETLNFAFIDGTSGLLDKPNGRETHNSYPGNKVTSGIYGSSRASALFDPSDALGKTYLGTGDHLFQIMTDPSDEYYGYYYYDSRRNAASYNQSQGRFYVYEYLEGTSAAIGDTNSSFLPLNSPYANTNGNNTGSYEYDGLDGEYAGVNHYEFTSKTTEYRVLTNFAFGMRMDVDFYLPDDPETDGNHDIHGNDMHFHFSGDDDVWVLIDGQLVLDIGGIHGVLEGDINFSTGEITVSGSSDGNLSDYGITSGEHTMTVLYLERGASQSNCSIYFNLAPRYGLDIRKEDVLTQEVLNGAEFSVFTDAACTQPAELYASESAYKQGAEPGNTFTVIQGVAHMWGFSPGKTYYITETKAPDVAGYALPEGVIQLTINKDGVATYDVEIADASPGFTVHGVDISEQTRMVYIVVTNAPEDVIDTTTVQVLKKWEDDASHSSDYITAYLTVTDPDGTIRQIREITLSDENDWTYTWTNLPKYDYDALAEVQYGIEESYESGYYSTVRRITEIDLSKTEWVEAASFINGESYILKSSSGYLSTTSSSDAKLKWVDEATAQNSSLALWTATVSSGKVKLANGAGQILTFNYSSSTSNRYFYATTGSSSYQTFTPVDAGTGFRLYATRNYRSYYIGSSLSSGRLSVATSSSSGLVLTPIEKITTEDIQDVEDWAYQITNTPLAADNETSVAVNKVWDIPEGYDSSFYQEYAVTVRLLANGINTGRTITLNLKNGWESSFLGLPYTDESGDVIEYTVEELWEQEKWTSACGEVVASDGSPPVYSVTITNSYRAGGPELPSTGSPARMMYMLCGACIMLASLVYGFGSRRKRERRMK